MARSFASGANTDQIDCGSASILQPLNGLTLAGWVNPGTAGGITYQAMFGRRSGSSNGDYALYFNGASASKLSFFGAGTNIDPGTNTIPLNTWSHVALTIAPTGAGGDLVGTIFIGGIQDSTVTSAITSLPSVTTDFIIGADGAGDNHFRGGAAAHVALWNTPLSATDLSNLASGFAPSLIRPSALVGYWPLAGTQSPEPDLSGNGNSGVLTGTSFVADPPGIITVFGPAVSTTLTGIPAKAFTRKHYESVIEEIREEGGSRAHLSELDLMELEFSEAKEAAEKADKQLFGQYNYTSYGRSRDAQERLKELQEKRNHHYYMEVVKKAWADHEAKKK